MHGRRREEYKARLKDEKVAAGLAKKAQQWFQVNKVLSKQRGCTTATEDNDPKETLQLIEKLLLVNPDPLYLWNHRREILLLQQQQGESEITKFKIQPELDLTAAALERNPKAYGTWFHRKWSIQQQLYCHVVSSTESFSQEKHLLLLRQELDLVANFLNLDERNFHCWNYRRFIIGCLLQVYTKEKGSNNASLAMNGSWNLIDDYDSIDMGPQVVIATDDKTLTIPTATSEAVQTILRQEWDFTTTKIQQNFSNGSAFHYRSKLLPVMLQNNDANVNYIQQELELIHDAIFTEPDDQTAWWYHQYILNYCTDNDDDDAILNQEKELLKELIATEDGQCKWVLLGMLEVLKRMTTTTTSTTLEQQSCLKQLKELDPDRKARYNYLLQQLE